MAKSFKSEPFTDEWFIEGLDLAIQFFDGMNFVPDEIDIEQFIYSIYEDEYPPTVSEEEFHSLFTQFSNQYSQQFRGK